MSVAPTPDPDRGRPADATPDPDGPWPIEDVYDPETLALIERAPGGLDRVGRVLRGEAPMAPTVPTAGDAPDDPELGPEHTDPDPAPDETGVVPVDTGFVGGAVAGPGGDAPVGSSRVSSGRGRSGVAGLLMAGMMTGVAEVLDPDRLQPELVEFTPDQPDPATLPVQFVHVPGDPSASRLIIRPWLFRH